MTIKEYIASLDRAGRTALVSVTAAIWRSQWPTHTGDDLSDTALAELNQMPAYAGADEGDQAAWLADRRLLEADFYPASRHALGGER